MSLDVAGMLAVRARVARLQEGLAVSAGDDPAVERHRRELFGDQAEPTAHPTEEPHRVLLEWVGQPSPRDSPLVLALKAKGLLSRAEVAALDRMALRTIRRVDGVTSRSLGTREGLAETYRWGPLPGSYVISVSFADADRILSLYETGREFRVVGKHAPAREAGPATRPDEDWRRLVNAWRAVPPSRPPLPPDPLALRYGPEEGLSRVKGPTGGYWSPMLG